MIPLEKIIERLPVIELIGSRGLVINRVVSLDSKEFHPGDICWVSDKSLDRIEKVSGVALIVSGAAKNVALKNDNVYLIVERPRRYFLELVREFFEPKKTPEISSRAVIDKSVSIGKNVNIESGVVIDDHCVVGDGSSIGSNTVIRTGTTIGSYVKIGANNTIGGVGFGYEKNEEGEYELIPHIGNVVIEDYVEIGNNTAIDRAVLGSTIIRKNAKIDNLVHIAHGVEIGENSLIIANAMIAGSVDIGQNVWVAPSASVLNKLKVGSNSVIGMGAVVIKEVQPGQTVVGNPAKDIANRK